MHLFSSVSLPRISRIKCVVNLTKSALSVYRHLSISNNTL